MNTDCVLAQTGGSVWPLILGFVLVVGGSGWLLMKRSGHGGVTLKALVLVLAVSATLVTGAFLSAAPAQAQGDDGCNTAAPVAPSPGASATATAVPTASASPTSGTPTATATQSSECVAAEALPELTIDATGGISDSTGAVGFGEPTLSPESANLSFSTASWAAIQSFLNDPNATDDPQFPTSGTVVVTMTRSGAVTDPSNPANSKEWSVSTPVTLTNVQVDSTGNITFDSMQALLTAATANAEAASVAYGDAVADFATSYPESGYESLPNPDDFTLSFTFGFSDGCSTGTTGPIVVDFWHIQPIDPGNPEG